ncbi:methyl-accepting chemotaxis protein [Pelagibacterium xiamenense]|uniref:methyl-accepting chemotaxis protein n=1 Tax=Pelagibacterium xiamenense TaxID=2901140 RepID=UPI001E3E4F34|nr:methyl-accepting chemotaxis protein [Pelagibacterium xiamenense]MCD7059072.1 methyl-accepting chemotaxis protein [Pelagibacterium xiamenense]
MKFRISTRLYIMGAIALGMMTVGTLFSVLNTQNKLVEERKTMLSSMTDTVTSTIAAYAALAEDGTLSVEEAQARAIEAIRPMRYSGSEYFWINDMNSTVVMHPIKPELENQDLSTLEDPNGKRIFPAFVETVAQSGSGFVDYLWPKPGSDQPQPKLSHVEGTEWGWIVGTGVYTDDLSALFWENAALLGAALVAGFIAMGAAAFVITRSITRPVNALTAAMGRLAEGDNSVDIPATRATDEVGDMARAVLVFKQAAIDKEAMEAEAAETRQQREAERAASEAERASAQADKAREAEADMAAVESLAKGLSALASGDLTYRITETLPEKARRLKDDFNATADKLSDVVAKLRTTSRALKAATGEILAGANDLSERTTKQAAAIEETSAAMDQLTSAVTANAEKADEAYAGSQTAAKLASEGGGTMQAATTAMERITSSSSQISNIIGMIDDIAFQTNLLALNASVEAARAGEAGKGFAVVAIEVRRLAQSAADASAEVKTLVERSGEEVAGGSKLVADAASKLADILEAVQSNARLMQGISEANREQTDAIREVSTAIRQMDEMTQHNAALVEETNAAIEQTEAQATELDGIVEVFTIDAANSAANDGAGAQLKSDARGLQKKASQAARSYLSAGNAAIDTDWAEF